METNKAIDKFKDFIEKKDPLKTSKSKKHLVIDFSELIKYDNHLGDFFLDKPKDAFECCEHAIELIKDKHLDLRLANLDIFDSNFIQIREIRAKNIGHLKCVKGLIRQISDVKPLIVSSSFECPSCGSMMNIKQLGKQITHPERCGCGRKGKFKKISVEYVDTQRMILEEELEVLEGAQQPKKLNVLLQKGLTNPELDKKTTPGTKVIVTGIIEEIPKSMAKGEATEREFLLKANYIKAVEEMFEDITITKDDEKSIKRLSKEEDLFEKLVKSFAPDIFGYENVKLGILLALFGSVPKFTRSNKQGPIRKRGNFHILLIGDPGVAKSSLAKFCALISPRYRYASGARASGAGLTTTLVKDEFMGAWAVEAGAIVLASGGLCVIDEFDKINPEDKAKLHECMEHSVLTIDKANIHATMKAETSILAVANPKFGRFDPYSLIPEQFDIVDTLISRFDSIFIVFDKVDEEFDKNVIKTLLSVHKGSSKIKPEIEPEFFKKYILYSKKIEPKLTKEAENLICDIYLNMRKLKKQEHNKAVTITPRQGEAIIRLSEASARARLSEIVEEKDVRMAQDLLVSFLKDIAVDHETGQLDIDRIETGTTTSKRNKIMLLINIITNLRDKLGNLIPIDAIINEAKDKNLEEYEIEEFIEKLKKKGDIIEPRAGFIQKM